MQRSTEIVTEALEGPVGLHQADLQGRSGRCAAGGAWPCRASTRRLLADPLALGGDGGVVDRAAPATSVSPGELAGVQGGGVVHRPPLKRATDLSRQAGVRPDPSVAARFLLGRGAWTGRNSTSSSTSPAGWPSSPAAPAASGGRSPRASPRRAPTWWWPAARPGLRAETQAALGPWAATPGVPTRLGEPRRPAALVGATVDRSAVSTSWSTTPPPPGQMIRVITPTRGRGVRQ